MVGDEGILANSGPRMEETCQLKENNYFQGIEGFAQRNEADQCSWEPFTGTSQ